MNFRKKSLAVFLSVLLLVLACVPALSACKRTEPDGNDPVTEPVTDGEVSSDVADPTPAGPELTVSFDEEALYRMDVADLAEALDVEVVSDGVGRKVGFQILGVGLTEDRRYIELVILADGIEQTVHLPYADGPLAIRTELKSLYESLTGADEKSFAFTVSGELTSDEVNDPLAFALRAIINRVDGAAQIALVDEKREPDKAILLYKDGILTLGGVTISPAEFAQSVADLIRGTGADSDPDESGYSLLTAGGADDGYVETVGATNDFTSGLDLTSLFVGLSKLLNACDRTLTGSLISQLSLNFSNRDGVYSLKTNSKKLIRIISLLSDDEGLFDLDEYIDRLDEQTAGALKAGDVKIELSLTMEDSRIALGVLARNERTGSVFTFSAAMEVSAAAYELPEASELKLQDITFAVPFVLPQSGISLTLNAVIHLSDLVTAADGDYVTAVVACGEDESAVRFALNNRYIYLDMGGLAELVGIEDPASCSFYQEFEIDGQPATFFEIVFEKLFGGPDEEDDPGWGDDDWYDDDDDDDDDDWTADPRFANGWGCTAVDENGLIIPIGTTEEELRQLLHVYVFDEDDNLVDFPDYQIEGFDSSASYVGSFTVVFAEGYDDTMDVVIYNPETVHEVGFEVSKFLVELGYPVADVQQDLYGELTMSDDNVTWVVYIDGFTIDTIDFVPVTAGTVFDQRGDHLLSVTRTATGETAFTSVHVYDPENLQIVFFRCSEEIYLEEDSTEEDIREWMYAVIVYDDESEQSVEDYEIIGYSSSSDFFEVRWGTYSRQVRVCRVEGSGNYDPDSPGGSSFTSILKYLRILDRFAGIYDLSDLYSVIDSIFGENRSLLNDVFTYEDGGVLHIVLNTENDRDLLAILNLFAGIPTEDGWQDIDEDTVTSFANTILEMTGIDLGELFRRIVGRGFAEVISELRLRAQLTFDDGIVQSVELNDGGENQYLVTGFEIHFADAAGQFALTSADVLSAGDFSGLPNALSSILAQILGLTSE